MTTTPELLPRSTWDTSSDRRRFTRALQPQRVRGIVFHYPGDGEHSRLNASQGQVAVMLRGYQRYHRSRRGWPDLGYCLAIDQAGRLYEGAGARVAAHSATSQYPQANHERVGILLVIGNSEQPSPRMIATAANTRAALIDGSLPGWPSLPSAHEQHGHRQMPGAQTRCPGDRVIELLQRGAFAAPITGAPSTPPLHEREDAHAKRSYRPGEVSRVQRILAGAGFYGGAIDDDYGWWTARAVRDYQAGQLWPLVTVDGDWGPATDAHATWTGELQSKLNLWRTSLPRLRTDFDYGDLTFERVAEWQRRNSGGAYRGIVDGKAGPVTTSALGMRAHP